MQQETVKSSSLSKMLLDPCDIPFFYYKNGKNVGPYVLIVVLELKIQHLQDVRTESGNFSIFFYFILSHLWRS